MAGQTICHNLGVFEVSLPKCIAIHEAGQMRNPIIEIVGDTLGKPQIFGIIFFLVIEGPQSSRANRLHIPGMKVFMGDEAKKAIPIGRLLKKRTIKL